ncbi:ExeM/NucH family extracellular endonuclease [Vibrio hippocampi]|uniref:LTD domain-containing protein n=1 Tax=Vibrio hippocampi TaxID=654686 RepID=A0ABM8ZNT7_9VIBR|nr:ExeM/NucH family extracellular endonuclease [Vibrio hippocampi]CAH0530331.1 hypothetical protein VHP8226_03973 [Vibrio hippocampi]
MNKSLISCSIALALTAQAQANIMITEYVEGSSYNKAIELYNQGSESVDLSSYSLVRYKDGDTSPTSMVTLSGTLAANELMVVYHSSSDIPNQVDLSGVATLSTGNLAHNGGDAVAILNGDVVVDIVGDVPTTSGWGKEVTLRRIGETASTVFDESDWNTYAQDTFDGLGSLSDESEEPEVPEAIDATIMEIQGDGWSSPMIESGYESEDYYKVTGIVTAIQEVALGSHLTVGFFIQDPDGDGDANTSDAIFVQRTSVSDVTVGDSVTVQGKAYENYGFTQLTDTYIHSVEATDKVVTATPLRELETDESFDFTLERHESMLVELDAEADMRVTRTFSFDYDSYRNNMVVSQGRVNLHQNQQNVPNSEQALTQAEENEEKRLFVESFEQAENGVVPWYPDFLTASAVPMEDGTTTSDDYIRVDDTLDGLQGVLGYSYSEYRLYVTNEATKENFIRNNARTTAPEVAEGELKVATFNVLNYFNSEFGGAENPFGDNRGADTEEEFTRQGDKIAKAIIALDADIVGLMEIENNGFGEDSAVNHLVTKINGLIEDESQHYQYVSGDDEYIGTDAIANHVIFKPASVSLETYRIIQMPEQHATEGDDTDNYQRDAVTPTFTINRTGENITVSVNHFKSKGSTCWEDVNLQDEEDADMQGSCENFRVSAAQQLGTEMANIDGYKLILGDLNSYGSEDPILLLTEMPEGYSVTPARDTFIGDEEMDGSEPSALTESFGYINAIEAYHQGSYSYSYNDTLGTLDYILVDADTINYVIDAADWNINASESSLVDYSTQYSGDLTKYSDMYRSSDHDPAIVVFEFSDDEDVPELVVPPATPVDLPQDVPEHVSQAEQNQPLSVVMLLTDLDDFDLHVGDKAMLVANKTETMLEKGTFAATVSSTETESVELTQEMIQQGWVELSTTLDESGDYQVSKVIEGYAGTYTSEAMDVTVAEQSSSDDSDSGGSTAPLGLGLLMALGLMRRRNR